jgi:dipeptidyl aminopeptidase/acylaminoacyl peptidase
MLVLTGLLVYGQFLYQPSDENWLAVVIVTENQNAAQTSAVFLYSPSRHSLRRIAAGSGVRWSPSGRYLAAVRTVNTIGLQMGDVAGFSIFDMETGALVEQDTYASSRLVWSPDEHHVILTGWGSSGLSGSNSWFDVLDGNGAGTIPYHAGFPDGIMGQRGGRAPTGWTDSGDLIVHDWNMSTGRDQWFLVDTQTGEEQEIDAEPAGLRPFNPAPEVYGTYWGETLTVASPDRRYVATVPDEQFNDLGVIQTPALIINDVDVIGADDVPWPENILDVQRMAWRPLP